MINWDTGIEISVRQLAAVVAAMIGLPDLVAEVSTPAIDPLDYVVADATRLKQLGRGSSAAWRRD